MKLLELRCWPFGPNLLSAGFYRLPSRSVLLVWFFRRPAVGLWFAK